MSKRRLAAALVLTAALAPTTWLRTPIPPEHLSGAMMVEPLKIEPAVFGAFHFKRAWHLDSESRVFGGFSALALLGPDTLLAGSDAGAILRMEHDGQRPTEGRLGYLPGQDATTKRDVDLEALSFDEADAVLWAAFERTNSIQKRASDLTLIETSRPALMRNWRQNSGPESIVALSDGRLLTIAEGQRDGLHDIAILSTRVDAYARLEPMEGFSPVDAVQVSPAEVLVLFRAVQWGVPARFQSAIAVYAVPDLRADAVWRPRLAARFPAAIPDDNYEGIAVIDRAEQGIRLWLISDDNFSAFQRTLLLEIVYDPSAHEKAREKPARSSKQSD